MMHMAVGRLEVSVGLAERVEEPAPERPTLAQRSYERTRSWQVVEDERAAWGMRSLMLRSGIAR